MGQIGTPSSFVKKICQAKQFHVLYSHRPCDYDSIRCISIVVSCPAEQTPLLTAALEAITILEPESVAVDPNDCNVPTDDSVHLKHSQNCLSDNQFWRCAGECACVCVQYLVLISSVLVETLRCVLKWLILTG